MIKHFSTPTAWATDVLAPSPLNSAAATAIAALTRPVTSQPIQVLADEPGISDDLPVTIDQALLNRQYQLGRNALQMERLGKLLLEKSEEDYNRG